MNAALTAHEFSVGLPVGHDLNAAEAAYWNLTSRAADLEPHHGGWCASDLPTLTSDEVRIVLRVRRIEVGDELARIDIADFVESLEAGAPEDQLYAVFFKRAMEQSARAVLFRDAQDEAVRRLEFAQWEER
jgi:hypothetical protein